MIVRQWVEIQKEVDVTVDIDDIMAEFQKLEIPTCSAVGGTTVRGLFGLECIRQ